MTQTKSGTIEALRTAIEGPVIGPSDSGYDEARKLWNADIDRRPAVIVQCTSATDVAAAVGFAQEHGLEIAVRGGAHSVPGHSVCDDGLMIDLSRLNAVTVDPEARRASTSGAASQARTYRSRPDCSGQALRRLRQGPAADCGRDQRTLRIHSRLDEGDSGRLSEVCLRLHGQDRHEAAAADREEHGGSEIIGASGDV